MLYMLDTDTSSYLIKGKSPHMEARLGALVPGMVCISVITRAEFGTLLLSAGGPAP